MKKVSEVESPVNANERFLYAIAVRLEILIEQLSGISQHLADKDGVAITSTKEETKTVEKKEEPKEEVKEAPKAKPRKKK